jgi:hypothetical protein
MIYDYEIVVAGIVSNLELTGYAPVSSNAISSWCNVDYVDKVLIIDGQSSDNTISIINDCSFNNSKCEIIPNSIPWKFDEWTWDILQSMENRIIEETNKLKNSKKILITVSSDNVFTEGSSQELKEVCKKLIEKEEYDFINYPFKKAITSRYISNSYPILPNWHVCSINKFNEKIEWKEISLKESSIKTNRPIKQLPYRFNHVPISYDMFCFTKKNIEDKINRHVEFHGKNKPSIDHYIKLWLSKLKRMGISKIEQNDHPDEAKKFIGYNLFGNLDI